MSSSPYDHPDAVPATVVEVADDVFAYVQSGGGWFVNNTGFLVGRRGVASIDSCSTERRTRDYLSAIGTVTRRPVRTLINTHHHGDHTFGNSLFAGATIVGHQRTRQEALEVGPPAYLPFWNPVEWGDIDVEAPFLTFSERVTLWVDELETEVRHIGCPAHTTNDSIVWVPEHRVLFSGDLVFNGATPFLLWGSVSGAMDAVEKLRELDAETIVPGHGDVGGPDLIDRTAAYLAFVLDLAKAGHAAGVTPLG